MTTQKPPIPRTSSKRILALTLAIALGWAIAPWGAAPAGAATKVDRIVAQVNRNIITLSELEARLALLSPAQKAALSASGESVETMVLNKMIEEELLSQAAAAYNITVTESEIDQAIGTILTENNINQNQLIASLKQGGMTLPAFRLQLRQELLTNKLIGMTVVNKLVVTEGEVTSFLNGKLPAGVEPLMSASGVSDFDGVRIIYLKCTPQSARQIMAKAQKIREEIMAGLPFEEAARKYSEGPGAAEGGNPGNITVSELQAELQAIAKQLTPGTVSEPLYGGQVVLLINVVPTMAPAPTADTDPKGGKTFTEEQRQTARRHLEQMKIRAKLDTYMETLKKNAVIKTML
jgi:peptidyl-prolyl cis-trans isomerase SurA